MTEPEEAGQKPVVPPGLQTKDAQTPHSHEGHDGHDGHDDHDHGHDHDHDPHSHSHSHDHEGDGGEGRPRRHVPGSGLIAGLATTARTMLRPARTREYPDVKPPLPPRSRGVIALLAENCTSCMLCARECPDWCIYIESHKETVPATEPGGRDRQQNVLDRFAIDFSLCMYCGICIEACPFDALFWSPEFEYAEFDIRNLLHESDRLSGWMASVPAPQLPDHRSAPPKELETARAAAEKMIAEQGQDG